jgi:hypothetical protein
VCRAHQGRGPVLVPRQPLRHYRGCCLHLTHCVARLACSHSRADACSA